MLENIHLRIQKYSRWEFRPGYIFDIPVYAYFLYLAGKARHLGFFSNVNPWMTLSGFAGHGKHEDLDKFDQELLPISIHVIAGTPYDQVEKMMKQKKIIYPCIAKPTLWRTWRDVKKIYNTAQLKSYLKRMHEDLLIQEFIDYPLEFGIFYFRIPGEKRWHITWIVEKKFMFLHGDGKHTMQRLVYHHPRAKYYYDQLRKEYANKRSDILADGEELQLNYIGNHVRWSVFYDVSHLVTPQLEMIIDAITQKVPWFYYGRYDIKAKSVEELYKGKFKIIELNGMWSLPTHIYDPKHKIWKAYKTLFQHRKIAYRISKENKKRGYAFMSIKEIHKIVKQYGI